MSSNPLRAMCIFLILARRQLYRGNENGICEEGNENDRYRMVNMRMNCAREGENRKGRTGNDRTWNDRLLLQP